MVRLWSSTLIAAFLAKQFAILAVARRLVGHESASQHRHRSECILPDPEARFVPEYLGGTGLMRYVKTRSDLPTYAATAQVELFWFESIVSAVNGWATTLLMGFLAQYHSAIKGNVVFEDGTTKTFVMEFWGTGDSQVKPYCVDEKGPKWQHDTVVVFTDGIDTSKYFGHKKHGFPIAKFNGDVANRLFDFVHDEWVTHDKRKTYVMWQWWPTWTPGDAIKHRNIDLICDSFTEAVYWKIPEIGGKLIANIPRLHRNYGVVHSEKAPEVVAQNDTRVVDFFKDVLKSDMLAYVKLGAHPVVLWDQFQDKYFYFNEATVVPKYEPMPLPVLFYQDCDRGTCTAPNCSFKKSVFEIPVPGLGHYCVGPDYTNSWHHLGWLQDGTLFAGGSQD